MVVFIIRLRVSNYVLDLLLRIRHRLKRPYLAAGDQRGVLGTASPWTFKLLFECYFSASGRRPPINKQTHRIPSSQQ